MHLRDQLTHEPVIPGVHKCMEQLNGSTLLLIASNQMA